MTTVPSVLHLATEAATSPTSLIAFVQRLPLSLAVMGMLAAWFGLLLLLGLLALHVRAAGVPDALALACGHSHRNGQPCSN